MIALGGPKLKQSLPAAGGRRGGSFNDSTGWA